MNAALFETVMYFKSAPEQWWRWVNNCNILELQDGRTLIYRDSLVEVMESPGSRIAAVYNDIADVGGLQERLSAARYFAGRKDPQHLRRKCAGKNHQ